MSNDNVHRIEAARSAVDRAVHAGRLTQASGHNVNRWLAEPYYAEYRDQLLRLVDEDNVAELDRLFWERIPFGTGGRRGPMSEIGSATINSNWANRASPHQLGRHR